MAHRIEAVINRAIPWHKNAWWWLILLEGILAVCLGLWILLNAGRARDLVIVLLGAYLAITGVTGLVGDFRRWREKQSAAFPALRHLIMIVVGVVAVWNPHITWPIATGFLLIGIIGLVLSLALPDIGEARWGILVVSALSLVAGVAILWALATGTFLIGFLGLGVLAGGCLLIAWAVRMARGESTPRVAAGV